MSHTIKFFICSKKKKNENKHGSPYNLKKFLQGNSLAVMKYHYFSYKRLW
uniref:Uncharacterized protein n=1 Tax=Lepeophtheirus salmonis TaxID=72036 RepID=A0A0K2TI30_LEPSM